MNLAEYLAENPKKHLIFDFDDTVFLMDKGGWPSWEGIKEIISRYDANIIEQFPNEPRSNYRSTNELIIRYGQAAKEEAMAYFNEYELPLRDTEKRNDELISFIRDNASNYDFSIWSSNTLNMLHHTLEKYDMKHIFTNVIGRDSVELAKPFPDGFYQIFDPTVHTRKDFLMIGDSGSDEQASVNAGIDFFKIDATAVDWQ